MASPIKFQFEANSDPVVQAINGLSNQMQSLSKESAEWTKIIAWDSILSMIGRVKGAVSELATTLTQAFIQPAVAVENVGASLGVLLGNQDLADALTESLQRMATNGVVSFEALHAAARPLTQIFTAPADISKWVGVFADIAAGSKVPAERLANMVARMKDMGKVEFTELANAGIPIFEALGDITGHTREELIKLGQEGKISTETLLAAFESLTAEGGPFHEMNTTLSNTTGGSFDTLAASWEEVMAEVGKGLNTLLRPALQLLSTILQECKSLFVSLTRAAAVFGTMWAGLKAFSLAKHIYAAVTAMTALNAGASTLLGVFRSIGRVGWMLAITAAVEALVYLYEKFAGKSPEEIDKIARQEEAKREAADEKRRKKEAERASYRERTTAREEFQTLFGELTKVKTVEEQEALIKRMEELEKKLKGDRFIPWREQAEIGMQRARQHDAQVELGKREESRMEQAAKDARKKMQAEFKLRSSDEQQEFLKDRLTRLGVSTSGFSLQSSAESALADAARKGDTELYESLSELMPLFALWEETMVKEHEAKNKAAAEAEKLAEEARQTREQLARDFEYDTSVMAAQASGDSDAVKRLEQQREVEDLTAKYQEAGIDEKTARTMATKYVRLKAASQADSGGGMGAQYVASSLASVGGGGVAHRLGDTQLKVSRQQLSTLSDIRSIVSGIASKTSIPVVA